MEWLQRNGMWIIVGLMLVLCVVWIVFSNKKRKKQEQDAQNLINAVGPGNKVKTIGGICGIVVEVDNEENTFILETGSPTTGKCYIKFDRQAIYQTDAVVEPKAAESPAEEGSAEEPQDNAAETDAENVAPAEEPAKKDE